MSDFSCLLNKFLSHLASMGTPQAFSTVVSVSKDGKNILSRIPCNESTVSNISLLFLIFYTRALSSLVFVTASLLAQSTGAAKYTNYISAEG